jgi:hypothetical protein
MLSDAHVSLSEQKLMNWSEIFELNRIVTWHSELVNAPPLEKVKTTSPEQLKAILMSKR